MSQNLSWIGYKTIVRKEVMRIIRIWAQTVVPPVITMTLYFIIFGNLIGKRIGDMGGFDPVKLAVFALPLEIRTGIPDLLICFVPARSGFDTV